jgi:hypothetical protein
MAKIIWKYPIPRETRFEIEMPLGAVILKVAPQNGMPVLWAMGDNLAEMEKRKFILICTGEDITISGKYIDTFLIENDHLVLHLFEITG